MSIAVLPRPRAVSTDDGERLATWWLTLGRSPVQVVDELVRRGQLTREQATVAVDLACRNRSIAAHPAGGRREPDGAPQLRLVRTVL